MESSGDKSEAQAFAQRLRQALADAGVAISPTVVAHEFNLRYWGRSISIHASRNWLQGMSLPRPDKLRVLAEWLRVNPQTLLMGQHPEAPTQTRTAHQQQPLSLADQRMLQTYLSLPTESRQAVQSVVAAFDALEARTQAQRTRATHV